MRCAPTASRAQGFPQASLVLALAAAALLTPRICAQGVRLDAGSADSPVAEGFTALTPDSTWQDGAAFGWVERPALTAIDAPVDPEPKLNEHSGRKDRPRVYTNALSQDHIEGQGPATLRVAAPAGAYRAWLVLGAAGSQDGGASRVWDTQVACGQGRIDATFPGPYETRAVTMAVVSEGTLDFVFGTRSRWLVNGLVLIPVADWERTHAELLASFEQDIYALPQNVLETWKHQPHVDTTPLPVFTREEQERGCVLYHRAYLACIWPNTVPLRREIDAESRAFAAWGEYEPLEFTIYPLRDMKDVRVEFSALTSRTGKSIPATALDVRYVKYMWVKPNYSTEGVYYRAPDVLMPLPAAVDLTKGENLRLWATIRVTPNTPAEVYTGRATVFEGGRRVHDIGLRLRVLPIVLEKDQSINYALYYHHPYAEMRRAPDAFSREWQRRRAELEHLDMVEHGMNGITLGLWAPAPKDGTWNFDFGAFEQVMDLCRKVNFDRPMPVHIPTFATYSQYIKKPVRSHIQGVEVPPPEFFETITAMVTHLEQERTLRQWPEFLYYPVDEPSTAANSVAFMVEVLKAIKSVPGVRTYVTADPVHEQFEPMRPFVDIWCCQPYNPDRDTILADMKARPGVEYWCYPNHISGENDHTPVTGARMTYGFGFWRSGFRTLIPWIYKADGGNPWNNLDSSYMDFMVRTDDDGSPIPVTLWEAFREGIDDGRYITTLERWIARARAAGRDDLAQAAAADLQFVWDSVEVQTKYKYDGMWDPDTFDVFRWLIARRILELQTALAWR
jgi:hypothetical protein